MRLWKLTGCLLLFTFCASAATIIASVPKGTGDLQIGGSIDQYIYTNFTTTKAFSNASIAAWIFGTDPITAYLTTAVGPTATTSTLVASVTLTPQDQINQGIAEPSIFKNLTLPAATYYLVIGPGNTKCCDDWFNGTTPVVTAPGVTVAAAITNNIIDNSPGAQNKVYPPTSIFFSNNLVAFDVVSAPEPSTFTMLALGAVLGAFRARKAQAKTPTPRP